MNERHELDQYFFVPETAAHLAAFAARFVYPCCLCAPTVGALLAEQKVGARVLDIDERFAATPGFLHYDLYRPHPIDETYSLILCDPPWDRVSLSQLFAAIRMLSQDDRQPLLISHPRERGANLMGTFAPFRIVPTGYFPRYVSVQKHARDGIELYGNLSAELHEALARTE